MFEHLIRTSYRSILTTTTLLAAVAFSTQHASAVTVTYENETGGDFRLASITDIDILGETYDVDFVHGGTYEDLAVLPGSPIEFTTLLHAQEAGDQIALAINALNTDGTEFTSLPGNVRVPWQVRNAGTQLDYARSTRVLTNPIFMSNALASTTNVTSPTSGSGSTTTEWALFTVVPEPSGLAMLTLGCLLLARRRRA